ncbi:MAG: alpha/beta hydrolase, partial [Solirubrobacteraceae bacterium]
VVPPTGPDPLERPTFAAVPRILRQLCSARQCAHITANLVPDLARLVRRMGHRGLRGRWVNRHGHVLPVALSSNELAGILIAGDLDPILRAEFPAAVRAAADGDTAALARLLARAAGGGGGGGEEPEEEGIDTPLYLATTCEELAFPWSRAASPRERLAQATAQIEALPASSIAPFTAANVLDLSDLRSCASWPFATPAPPVVPATMPDVPTLILSGADDLRTPTSGARALAAEIPGSHLVVVPNTGHSVLGTEPTHCAHKALLAMFAGHSIAPCPAGAPSPFLRPTPLPPERLSDVRPAHGSHGRAGRTLTAVALTLADFSRQFLLQLIETAGGASGGPAISLSSLSSGGLRAGWAQLTRSGLRFHGYSYVPGVTLSGTVKAESIALRIGGRAAAHGTLRLGARKALVGTLGGQHVHILPSHTASGAIVGADAQASPDLGLGGSRARAAVRKLAGALGRLPWL